MDRKKKHFSTLTRRQKRRRIEETQQQLDAPEEVATDCSSEDQRSLSESLSLSIEDLESSMSTCSLEKVDSLAGLSCGGEVLIEDQIENALINWFSITNSSKLSFRTLLHQLNYVFPSLKLTPESLIKTVDNKLVTELDFGRMAYFPDWIAHVQSYVEKNEITEALLQINVDGIPLFRDSRKYHLYPILIKNFKHSKIFCAGIYLSEVAKKIKCHM